LRRSNPLLTVITALRREAAFLSSFGSNDCCYFTGFPLQSCALSASITFVV